MRRRSVLFLFAISAFSVACATDPNDDDFVSTDVTDDAAEDVKADQAELPFTPVEGLSLRSSIGRTEEGRVIRTSAAFRTAFGTTPPAGLDFHTDWLAVYSAGGRTTGGYTATITRIALSDSGKTVKVTSHLTTPGADCFVTEALTKPIAVVRFPAQPTAAHARFTKITEAHDCTAGACGALLTTILQTQVVGMLFMSESDRPWEVVSFGVQAGPPTIAKLLALTSTPAGTTVEQRSYTAFLDHLSTVQDPNDPFMVDYAARYLALRKTLEANLHDLTVIRIGTIAIDVYIVGISDCGEMVAIKTVSVET